LANARDIPAGPGQAVDYPCVERVADNANNRNPNICGSFGHSFPRTILSYGYWVRVGVGSDVTTVVFDRVAATCERHLAM
jgi:hypothetical protein